jgi:hypothetical protein
MHFRTIDAICKDISLVVLRLLFKNEVFCFFMYLKFTFVDRNVRIQSPREICCLKDSIGGYTSCTYSLRPGFHSEPVRVGFVLDKDAVVQVFPGVPPFPTVSNIPQILHTHSTHRHYIILERLDVDKQGAETVPKLKGGEGE